MAKWRQLPGVFCLWSESLTLTLESLTDTGMSCCRNFNEGKKEKKKKHFPYIRSLGRHIQKVLWVKMRCTESISRWGIAGSREMFDS